MTAVIIWKELLCVSLLFRCPKVIFSKDVNGWFPSLPSSQGGWGVLCVNVSSAAWSLEAQGKGVAGKGSLVIFAFPFFFSFFVSFLFFSLYF